MKQELIHWKYTKDWQTLSQTNQKKEKAQINKIIEEAWTWKWGLIPLATDLWMVSKILDWAIWNCRFLIFFTNKNDTQMIQTNIIIPKEIF
jgi:hypothetical protein